MLDNRKRDSDTWTQSTVRNSDPIDGSKFKEIAEEYEHNNNAFHEQTTFASSSRPVSSMTLCHDFTPKVESEKAKDVTVDVEAKGDADIDSTLTWAPQKKEWLIMASLAFISFIVALDSTILVTVLPEIAQKLNGTSVEAFWAGTSYLLTSAISQPVIASISRVFGRQALLLLSILTFLIGTILCANSHDFTLMLTGRVIQGCGGGGIVTLTQVIFCDIVPLRQRPKYFSMVLGAWSVGSIVGPVVGGALTEHVSWRWCFHLNYPFCGIGLVVAALFVRLNSVEKLTLGEKLKRTDWLGVSLFVGSMTSFLVGLSWGGIQHPWTSAATLAPMIAGLVGILVFVGWQHYKKTHTLLPMSLFYNWSAIAAFYCAMINGLILFSALYYVPFYVMSVRGKDSTEAGIDLFPAVCLLIPGSIVVSVLTSRLGRFRWAVWSGWAVTTLAYGLFIVFDLHTKMVVFATCLAIFGIGTGMVLTSVNVAIQAIAKEEDAAMAASMYGFFRSLGMPLGVAISGTIFQNAMSSKLTAQGLPSTIAHDSERWVFVLRTMAEGPKKTAILEAYMKGFDSVFIAMTGIAASALVASFVIRKFSMDKILLAQFTAR